MRSVQECFTINGDRSSSSLSKLKVNGIAFIVYFLLQWSFLNAKKIFFRVSQLVSWCFELSHPQRITSGLKTNFSLSPSYSLNKLHSVWDQFNKQSLIYKFMNSVFFASLSMSTLALSILFHSLRITAGSNAWPLCSMQAVLHFQSDSVQSAILPPPYIAMDVCSQQVTVFLCCQESALAATAKQNNLVS